jgi:uncharacterized protein GlcG (DUF336 family)/mannose-6-phosphate isomerase-like protein (cupin superfamily)
MLKTFVTASLFATLAFATESRFMEKKTLTLEGAKTAASAIAAEAHKNKVGSVIAVVDDGGNVLLVERLDGSFAAGPEVAIGKARTAAKFRIPTRNFEEALKNGRTAVLAIPGMTPVQGGVPIVVDGQVIGAVGVSGAATAAQDEEFSKIGAAAAVREVVRPVRAVDKNQVDAAFAKGMPLIEVENYKIHASRREGPGKVEVHTRDTDIVHVLTGTATLVTGGRMTNGKAIEDEEIRGDFIEGGATRTISPGDVIVIPSGVPHWFREVPGPLTYYVVKVRSEEGGPR